MGRLVWPSCGPTRPGLLKENGSPTCTTGCLIWAGRGPRMGQPVSQNRLTHGIPSRAKIGWPMITHRGPAHSSPPWAGPL
ncbi:hypothetical protein TorRG33x02_339070 [Trema orientale]|uniref:Uncharacterized protein n=1 Tax=Trema orientale TaxID=63057 RepID=A0A2P5AX02_TREOI|nr:hypothetical protein TorRG33x02_339070 [Trema orientale]